MIQHKKEKILVVGTGNIGMGLALELMKYGHDVFCIGRGKVPSGTYSSIIMQTLDGDKENKEVVEVPKVVQFDEIQGQHFNRTIITTKIHDSVAALRALHDYKIHSQSTGVIQNGLVPENFFSDYKDVSIISIYEGFYFDKEKGILRRMKNDRGWSVSDRELADFLNTSGIKAIYEDGKKARAIKLLYNSTLNGISALENKTLGDILQDDQLCLIAQNLFHECYSAISKQYNLDSEDKLWNDLSALCNGPLFSHHSSTHQDYQSGKPTEIDFLNGFITNLGQESGITTPLSDYITKCIKGYLEYSRTNLLTLLQ